MIVGNTTKRRHDLLPADYNLPSREAAVLLEEGGYSGPQLFEKTLALTRRYRTLLDEGMDRRLEEESSSDEQIGARDPSGDDILLQIKETTARDAENLKPDTPEARKNSKSQPLIRLPAGNNPFSSDDSLSTAASPVLSASHHLDQLPPKQAPKRKLIFASGGISNGTAHVHSISQIWVF